MQQLIERGQSIVFHLKFDLDPYNPLHTRLEHGIDVPERERNFAMLKSKKILIVDDEPAMVQLTSKTLERLGYRVTGTLDPKEALQLIKADPGGYDLMITDMVMPNLNGAQLAKLVLEIQPGLPIILCSGHCNLSSVESNEIGIRKFLRKPVALDDLEKEVRTVLVGEVDI